jgi:hypothetical protein
VAAQNLCEVHDRDTRWPGCQAAGPSSALTCGTFALIA